MTGTRTRSASRSTRTAFTVTSSGSPGPIPTRQADASCRVPPARLRGPARLPVPPPLWRAGCFYQTPGQVRVSRPVQVQVGSVDAVPYEALSFPAVRPRRGTRAPRDHGRSVELVTTDGCPGWREHGRAGRDRVAVAERELAGHPGGGVEYPAHRLAVELGGQVQQGRVSAATGVPIRARRATSARSRSLADSSLACTSGNPPPSTRAPVPGGRDSSRSGLSGDHVGASGGEQLHRLGVAERERRPARDRHDRGGWRAGQKPGVPRALPPGGRLNPPP